MSTMEIISTGWKAARQASRQRHAERATATRSRPHGRVAAALAEHGLTITGFACFTAAAMMVAIPLGLVVAGIGFFILELRAGE